MKKIKIIGAGLAGAEAAWQAAAAGCQVELWEMRPARRSPAHSTDYFAELVCSNSLRAAGLTNAVGLLKEEMRRQNSLIMACADLCRVPAGGALAVDREGFGRMVTERVLANPAITVHYDEVQSLEPLLADGSLVIVAAGPLLDGALAEDLRQRLSVDETAGEYLHFHDAVAPIVDGGTIDMSKVYWASRYGKDGDFQPEDKPDHAGDYLNCPMDKQQYLHFYQELLAAERVPLHNFEQEKDFEGCMPIESMASRGEDTIRFGPLKPVGLGNPYAEGREPYAVVQLRRDNQEGSVYNLVGFQTHLRFPEQRRVFSMIPALHDAEFLRYGVMHRNTFLNSPRLLDRYYRLMAEPRVSFAGQMTGVEGYVESAASGFLAGVETARRLRGLPPVDFPQETAVGALGLYVSNRSVTVFQPMNINFGIMPPLGRRVKGKRNKNAELSRRSLEIIEKLRETVLE